MPRMNSIMERRIQACRHELLDSNPRQRVVRSRRLTVGDRSGWRLGQDSDCGQYPTTGMMTSAPGPDCSACTTNPTSSTPNPTRWLPDPAPTRETRHPRPPQDPIHPRRQALGPGVRTPSATPQPDTQPTCPHHPGPTSRKAPQEPGNRRTRSDTRSTHPSPRGTKRSVEAGYEGSEPSDGLRPTCRHRVTDPTTPLSTVARNAPQCVSASSIMRTTVRCRCP